MVGVRPPHQGAHLDSSAGDIAQQVRNGGAGGQQQFIGVASPVGEVHPVARADRFQLLVEAAEVRRTVHQGTYQVASQPAVVLGSSACFALPVFVVFGMSRPSFVVVVCRRTRCLVT